MPGTLIASPQYVSLGENSRMAVGGNSGNAGNIVYVRFASGQIGLGGSPTDVMDNMSGGFTEKSRGGRNCTVRAECRFRAADNPLSFPPKFVILELTPRIIIWPDKLNDENQYFKFPTGFCEGYDVSIDGSGNVSFSLSLSNQGVFYYPASPDPGGVFA